MASRVVLGLDTRPARSRGVCWDGGFGKYFFNSFFKEYQQIITASPGLCLPSTRLNSVVVFLGIVRASPLWDRK